MASDDYITVTFIDGSTIDVNIREELKSITDFRLLLVKTLMDHKREVFEAELKKARLHELRARMLFGFSVSILALNILVRLI